MYRGIIQSTLANRIPLELDYREPSTDEENLASQPISEEFACLLRTLTSGQENVQ